MPEAAWTTDGWLRVFSTAAIRCIVEPAATVTTQPTGLADFGLTLAAVRVEGFRLLRDVSLALKPSTTVLLGENNSGKTSFLEALAVAFGQRQPQKEDIFSGPDGVATCFQIDLRIQPAGKQFNHKEPSIRSGTPFNSRHNRTSRFGRTVS